MAGRGPGFLKSVYQAALAYELEKANIPFEKEKTLPVAYEDIFLEVGFRCDFLVDKRVIIECKSVKEVTPLDHAQLLNYLKITNLNVGLLINFNVRKLTDGIQRIVNKYKEFSLRSPPAPLNFCLIECLSQSTGRWCRNGIYFFGVKTI